MTQVRTIAVTPGRVVLAVVGLLSVALSAVTPAAAANRASGLYVRGAGNGHGVGMSQYGAAGYALHGASYQQILHNYYVGTTLGHVDPNRSVTVLLRPSGPAGFSGADAASAATGVPVKLNPLARYSVYRAAGGRLRMRLGLKSIGVFTPPLQVGGPGPLSLIGLGAFRGVFVFRPNAQGDGVMTVNAVGLDDYVRGVVAAEMPPSWPAQALDAQAIAARTYAITSKPVSADFDVYDSTRSQTYQGVKAEAPSSDAAVAATSGQVVEYAGVPVTTYFFASSGGETESDQNVFPLAPAAWLVGRPDPYDDSFNNPYFHWTANFSLAAAQRRLGNLVDGSLVGIKVIRRGVSPRVITAKVVGTSGSVTVTGLQLRQAFGTPSTWMSFTTVSSHGIVTSTTPAVTTTLPAVTTTLPATTPTAPPTTTGPEATPTVTSAGGGLIRPVSRLAAVRTAAEGELSGEFQRTRAFIERVFAALRVPTRSYVVTGTVFPARPGSRLAVQLRRDGRWATVRVGRIERGGRYWISVGRRGAYRVRFNGTVGPEINVG
jgi:stage II sporulation protein D